MDVGVRGREKDNWGRGRGEDNRWRGSRRGQSGRGQIRRGVQSGDDPSDQSDKSDTDSSNSSSDEGMRAERKSANKNLEYNHVRKKTNQGVGSKIPELFDDL